MHKRVSNSNFNSSTRLLVGFTSGLIGITVISGSFLMSGRTHADDVTDVVDTVNLTIPVSCTFGSGGGTYNDTMVGGTTKEITANAITTSCNDNSGYAIYAVGYSNGKYASDSSGSNTDMIASVGSTHNITTSSNNTYGSSWKMKITSPVDATIEAGFSDYTGVPATFTKVAAYTTNTTGGSITPKYQITTGSSQPAGTYTGKVKYTLVHPASEEPVSPQTTQANKICYYANASSAVGTMGCQSIPSSGGSATTITPTSAVLLASNFSRAGYGFAGWSDSYDYATNPNAKFYGPQEYIEFTEGQYSGTDEGLSLYAVWVKSQGNLQNSSKVTSLCGTGAGSLTTAPTDGTANLRSISALTDQRDNETYAIAKLADGNCWMIENLRLESTNSDNTTGALAQGYGTSATYGNFSGLASAESANFNNTEPTAANSATNSLYSSDGSTTINIGLSDNPAYRMPRYNSDNHQTTSEGRPQNPTSNSADNSTTSAGMYSYGNYYTWAAAIADTTHYGTNNISVTNTSLCPKGWRLPQGGNKTRITSNDDNDFWNLTVDYLNGGTNPANYGSSTYPYYNGTAEATPVANKLRSFPNNFLYSGYFNGSLASSRGSVGYYWSSTAYYNDSSYYLYLDSSYIYPGTYGRYKYNGRSIRCVAGS